MTWLLFPYPVSTNRYLRHVKIGRAVRTLLSREAREYRETVGRLCTAAGAKPQDGPLEMWVELHPRLKADGSDSKVRVDIDNAVKVALDCCQGHLYGNDSQIVSLHAKVGRGLADGGLSVRVDRWDEGAK